MGKEKRELIEKIEWIKREIKCIGTSNNEDNFNDLIKSELYRKLNCYEQELAGIVFNELDDIIKNDIEQKREQQRNKFWDSLRK